MDSFDFLAIIEIVFITLKLLNKIDWSWWWVLSPIWITTILVVSIISLAILISPWLLK